MTSKTLFTFAATCLLALGLVAARADDKPGQSQTGQAQPAGDKSAGDGADKGKGKMSMAQMMKDCMARATACQKHIDAAAASADANRNEETKKHLAMAQKEMAACMKMMNMMDMMHGKEGKQAEHGKHGEHGRHEAGAAGEKKAGQ